MKLKQKFIEKGYESDFLDKHISIVEKLDRNEMLKEKVRENAKQTCIPLTLATAFVQTSVKWYESIELTYFVTYLFTNKSI